MNVRILFLVAILWLGFSCTKEAEVSLDCPALQPIDSNYHIVPYIGQDIGCHFYLELFVFEGEPYFIPGSFCADVEAILLDCEGNRVEEQERIDIWENAERKGIIGIYKEKN